MRTSITQAVHCRDARYNLVVNLLSRRQFTAMLAPLASRLRALPLSAVKLGITTDEIDDEPLVIVLSLLPRQSVPPLQSVATFHAAFALSAGARPLR
jgi:hypothetical protein